MTKVIKDIIQYALNEDIGQGDITSDSIIDAKSILSGKITAKESGVIAGLEIAKSAFSIIDPNIEFEPVSEDGKFVNSADIVALVKGNGRAILRGERVVLNIIQRMSGIATLTRKYADLVKGTKAKILDTRKTAPGLRMLDKMAVKIGGGVNHRFGLYDMVLIKENHITAAGGIIEAVNKVRERYKNQFLIEIEIDNIEDLNKAIELKVDRILLDNMTLEDMRHAVDVVNGRIPLEASGNVNLNTVKSVADTGVDYISIGALTHSVKALDLSLLIENIA